MHPVVGPEGLESLDKQGMLVGILVAPELNQTLLRWIFDVWPRLHKLSGANWHIAIPCEANPQRQGQPQIEDFNIEFSNKLRNMYGINRTEGAVLVLDDFKDETNQLYMKISLIEEERDKMFYKMAEFIDNHVQSPEYPGHNDLGRCQLIGALYNHMQRERISNAFVNSASNSISGALRLFRWDL